MSEILQNEESVRLYEYETYKPDLEDYIAHHGVKDMHWGVKNGPPYPLSSKLSTGSRLKKGAKGTGTSYGGRVERLKKKAARASVKAARANKKAAQSANEFFHPIKNLNQEKYQTKAFKAQSRADRLNAKLNKAELREQRKKELEETLKKTQELKEQQKQPERKPFTKEDVEAAVKKARETGMYDMEFLERNLDLDPETETQMKGKALEDAYRKFLTNEYMTNRQSATYGGKEKDLKKLSAAKAEKKSIGDKIHDYKVNKQRKASLEKARQTKAENTAKKKAEEAEKERISKMREEAIKKNDIVTMYKNADHFSRSEIEEALNRKGTLDRLANEVAKMTPQPQPKQSKVKKVANMAKESVKSGLASSFKNTVSNVSSNALKMTMEELAIRAAGGEGLSFNKLDPKQKAQFVRLLFRGNKG